LGIIERPGSADTILDALRRGLQLLEEKKIRAELVTITGEPIREIIKRTEEHHFDLVVIGATRKGSRGLFWISSKAYKIIKTIHPPVLVVLEKSSRIKRILLCTGGQKYIANAVTLTGQIARGMQASVTLFHVMPEPPPIYARLYRLQTDVDAVLNSKSELGRNLREQKKILEDLGVNVEVKLREGSVISEILREIQAGNYDLLVAGSSLSRASLRTYILGDITREIVNRACCAVLIVRSGITGEGILHNLSGWLERITHHHKPEKTGRQ
ncbi:MAG TPA: universal stress protein, partial [Verrucomicrobiae bacterium]|nr:universal stress protein [Verrucomicrobiae bacterium]